MIIIQHIDPIIKIITMITQKLHYHNLLHILSWMRHWVMVGKRVNCWAKIDSDPENCLSAILCWHTTMWNRFNGLVSCVCVCVCVVHSGGYLCVLRVVRPPFRSV